MFALLSKERSNIVQGCIKLSIQWIWKQKYIEMELFGPNWQLYKLWIKCYAPISTYDIWWFEKVNKLFLYYIEHACVFKRSKTNYNWDMCGKKWECILKPASRNVMHRFTHDCHEHWGFTFRFFAHGSHFGKLFFKYTFILRLFDI